MKKLFFIAFLFLGLLSIQAQGTNEITTFILVRHAEKGTDDPRNPSLNEVGKQRAEKLSEMLKDNAISALFSTPYKRTEQTLAPLAQAKNLKIESYDPRSNEFVNDLLKKYKGGTIVISGHSNTTPFLVNYLLGEDTFQQLDESEYGKIFMISLTEIGKGKVTVINY